MAQCTCGPNYQPQMMREESTESPSRRNRSKSRDSKSTNTSMQNHASKSTNTSKQSQKTKSANTPMHGKTSNVQQNKEMICFCFPSSAAMTSNQQNCYCGCPSNAMRQQEDHQEMMSETLDVQNDDDDEDSFYTSASAMDTSILEVDDDPDNSSILGRNYRVNSFR